MILRPVNNSLNEIDNSETKSLTSGSCTSIKNTIVVHDLSVSPYVTHGSVNDMIGTVTQTVEYIVKGFPDTGVGNKPANTFIKRMYFYTGHFSSAYKDDMTRFERGILRPNLLTTAGYSDINIRYGLAIHDISKERTTFIRKGAYPFYREIGMCPAIKLDNFEEDDNNVFKRYTSYELSKPISGKDIMNIGETSLSYITSNYNDEDISIVSNVLRSEEGNWITNPNIKEALDVMEYRMYLRNLLVDIILPYMTSLYETCVYIYEQQDDGFKSAVSPFGVVVEGFTIPNLAMLKESFSKSSSKLLELAVGDYCVNQLVNSLQPIDKTPIRPRVTIRFTETDAFARLTFLKNNTNVTMRMTIKQILHLLVEEASFSGEKEEYENQRERLKLV